MKSPAEEKQLSLKANMLWNSIGSMVYLGCNWLITVLVVRLSQGYDAAGILSLGMSVANIFSAVGYYKVRTFQVSDVNGEYSDRQYIGFRLITTALSLAAMIAYAVATCPTDAVPAIAIYCVFSCGPLIADVFQGEAQRKNRLDIAGKDLAGRGIIALVLFSFIMMTTASLELSLLGMTVGTFAFLLLYLVPAVSKIKVDPRPTISLGVIKQLALTLAPAVIALSFINSTPAVPRQALEALCGTDLLGIYSSIAAPVLIVQMGATYIYSPLLGSFAEHFTNRNYIAFASLLAKTTLAIAAMTLVISFALAIVGEPLLVILFGEDIRSHVYLLFPLIACTAITAFTWFIGDLLIVARDIKGNLTMSALSFAICAVSMVPLIEAHGANGATFAVIAGFACGIVLGLVKLYSIMRSAKEKGETRVL